jgi:signal peptidase I
MWSVFTVLVLAGWFFTLRPGNLGGTATYVMVQGESMEPTYHTGDLVIVRAQQTYAAGDVVAYRVPEEQVGEGAVVIHRITGGEGARGYVLRGDNNDTDDDWRPTDQDVAGKAWIVVPRAGVFLRRVMDPAMMASLAAAATVMIVMMRKPKERAIPMRRRAVGASH